MAEAPDDLDPEEIVMTPTKKGRTTIIHIEKKRRNLVDTANVAHKGDGEHRGLVINKQQDVGADTSPPDLQLEFKCFLVDGKTQRHVPESRVLKFWFREGTDYLDKVTGAYEFFKELVKPDQFPRDYVGFIKKVMKQIQVPKYKQMRKLDVDMMQLQETEAPAPAAGKKVKPIPPKKPKIIGLQAQQDGLPKKEERPREEVVQESLLLTLESAYPNVLNMEDLADMSKAEEMEVLNQLKVLQGRDLVREMEPGKWVRKVLDDKTEVKIVKQMPVHTEGGRPTIAIITSKYTEKLAVDSMMERKTTFVRYKTEGESNVYTIGYIGSHKVVSTKLPQIGRQRAAQISSGNTTTRLLGTFGDVEHVFLVGVAGGVPHYTDFYKHVRLGDIIVSVPNPKGLLYVFCDQVTHDEAKGQISYALKSWSPHDMLLQNVAEHIRDYYKANPRENPLEQFIAEGQDLLRGQESNFNRPPSESDRLYMNIGGHDVIEVGHPAVPEEVKHWYRDGVPVVRYGALGAGKPIVKEERTRLEFAARHNCVGFDTEFDQVLESIVGNRKDSFVFIRGISDYCDGTKNTEWQSYAALAAAGYMKTLILSLPTSR